MSEQHVTTVPNSYWCGQAGETPRREIVLLALTVPRGRGAILTDQFQTTNAVTLGALMDRGKAVPSLCWRLNGVNKLRERERENLILQALYNQNLSKPAKLQMDNK